MRSVRIQHLIYEYDRNNGGFNDSAAGGNIDPGYYREIEEVASNGLVHSAQASETNSIVSGERTSGIYQEISESHMDFPQAADYEEVLNMNTPYNYPSLRDGMAEESAWELRPKVAKPYGNVHDNPSYDNIAVSEMPNVNSMNENGVKLSSIAKAAGETTLVDEDIHEGRGGMVAVENETYAHQPRKNIVKTAEGIVLMDNDLYESGDNMLAIENAAHEDEPISIVKAGDETNLLDNDIYDGDGGMVGMENDAHEDKPITIVEAGDETDLMDNDIYESDGGMVAKENEAHKENPISIVKSADVTDLMDNDIYESDGGMAGIEEGSA